MIVASPPHCMYDYSRKIVLMLYSVCDVINSEISLSFLRKPFFYVTKM